MFNITHTLKVTIISILLVLMTGSNVYAKAGLLLFPTRVNVDNNERSSMITIKNTGDTRGLYRIELIDMEMLREGGTRVLDENEVFAYSAKKITRISPRRVLVDANSTQNIRISVRKPKNLEEGEYRSHLKITLLEDNVDENGRPMSVLENNSNNVGIKIKARMVNVIPLIVRQGKTQYDVTLGTPSLKMAESDSDRHVLIIPIQRTGNQSSLGNIKVEHISGSKITTLKMQSGVAVYRPLDERLFELPLDVPNGVSLKEGVIKVTYSSPEGEEENKYSTESELVL